VHEGPRLPELKTALVVDEPRANPFFALCPDFLKSALSRPRNSRDNHRKPSDHRRHVLDDPVGHPARIMSRVVCTSAAGVERGQGEGGRANRPRCRMAGADCTAESRRALPRVTQTPSSTAAISAETIEARRKIAALLRAMRLLWGLLDKLMPCEEPKLVAITIASDQSGHGTSCRPSAGV
jgi:hypothetical protein